MLVHEPANMVFNVPRGASLDQTLARLEKEHILGSAFLTRLYIKLTGNAPLIKAGDYQFASPINAYGVLDTLRKGGIEPIKLTIIEGWTRYEIADAMVKIPSLKLTRKDALKLMDDVSLVKDFDPKAANLEGYLFPDTYFVESDTKAKQLITEMVQRFRQVMNGLFKNHGNPEKRSPHDLVVAASVIETEAKLAAERPVVASVIYNRLKIGMPLAMDSTIVYASKLAGKWKGNGIVYQSDLDLRSPYNTRKYKGLPPGPVSSPGESSLKAALLPANTGFIYYVRDPDFNDGKHNFYVDATGFEAGVAKLRRWEATQKAAGRR